MANSDTNIEIADLNQIDIADLIKNYDLDYPLINLRELELEQRLAILGYTNDQIQSHLQHKRKKAALLLAQTLTSSKKSRKTRDNSTQSKVLDFDSGDTGETEAEVMARIEAKEQERWREFRLTKLRLNQQFYENLKNSRPTGSAALVLEPTSLE